MNKLFPIVLPLLFFSCSEDSPTLKKTNDTKANDTPKDLRVVSHRFTA